MVIYIMHGYMIHLSNLIKRKKIENAHLFPLSSNNSCSNSQSSVGSNLLIFCHGSGLCWSRRSTWRRGSTGRWSTSGWTSSPASPCSRSPSASWQSSRRSRSFPRSHSSLYLYFYDRKRKRQRERKNIFPNNVKSMKMYTCQIGRNWTTWIPLPFNTKE